MHTCTRYRWLGLALALGLLRFAAAAPPTPLDDHELHTIVAAGLNITIELDFDAQVAAPGTLLIDPGQLSALQQLGQSTTRVTSTHRSATGGLFDSDGINLPNLQSYVTNTVVNNISITDQALQNAQSLLNIIALGDVAVGMNLVVVVNPGDTPFTITQTNINWSDLLGSLPTPTPGQP